MARAMREVDLRPAEVFSWDPNDGPPERRWIPYDEAGPIVKVSSAPAVPPPADVQVISPLHAITVAEKNETEVV